MRKIIFVGIVSMMFLSVSDIGYGETLPESIKEMVLKDIGFYKPVEGPQTPVLVSFLFSYGYIGRTDMKPTEKLRPYLREGQEQEGLAIKLLYNIDDVFYVTLAKRVLKSIDYTNKWKLDNLDAWSFTFTYFMEPVLPELPRPGPFTGKGTAILNPATGKFDTVFEKDVGSRYGSSLGDQGGLEYFEWLKKQTTSSKPKPSQLPAQAPIIPETPEKITMDWLTKSIPDTDYFQEREKTFDVSFENVWEIISTILSTAGFKLDISDKEKGILLTDAQIKTSGNLLFSINAKEQYAILIEKISENATKITVKGFTWATDLKKEQWNVSSKVRKGDEISEDFLKAIEKVLFLQKPEVQKLAAFISDQWKQIIQMPQPKRNWRELVTLKFTGNYDDYSTLYLMGVNRRNLASDALISANTFLKIGDLKNAQKYAALATRHYIESNELFKSGEQVFSRSVSMTVQALEAIYRGPKEASKYGWYLMCGPKCYEVADYVFLVTDYVVDIGLEGVDEAKKNLAANAFVKAILQVGGVSKWIENRPTILIRDSGLYKLLDKTIQSSEFKKAFIKVLVESGIYTTKEMAEKGAKTLIQNAIDSVRTSSKNNLKPQIE